jgi:hypothetical protein
MKKKMKMTTTTMMTITTMGADKRDGDCARGAVVADRARVMIVMTLLWRVW